MVALAFFVKRGQSSITVSAAALADVRGHGYVSRNARAT